MPVTGSLFVCRAWFTACFPPAAMPLTPPETERQFTPMPLLVGYVFFAVRSSPYTARSWSRLPPYALFAGAHAAATLSSLFVASYVTFAADSDDVSHARNGYH